MGDGTVFIAEEWGERPFEWSGTWSAHWESDDAAEFIDGPQRVSASQAIAWGRARASVVLIRPGDGVIHSAGACEPKLTSEEPEPLPRWVEGRELDARFAAGREYYGRDPQASPIDWRTRIPAGPTLIRSACAKCSGQPAPRFVSSLRPPMPMRVAVLTSSCGRRLSTLRACCLPRAS